MNYEKAYRYQREVAEKLEKKNAALEARYDELRKVASDVVHNWESGRSESVMGIHVRALRTTLEQDDDKA